MLAGATSDAALVLGIRILVRLPHAVREVESFRSRRGGVNGVWLAAQPLETKGLPFMLFVIGAPKD